MSIAYRGSVSATHCLAHHRPAQEFRLKYPQPDSTPPPLRWEHPGPALWMCDECAKQHGEWSEPVASLKDWKEHE